MELNLLKGIVEPYPNVTMGEFAKILSGHEDEVEGFFVIKQKPSDEESAQEIIDEC